MQFPDANYVWLFTARAINLRTLNNTKTMLLRGLCPMNKYRAMFASLILLVATPSYAQSVIRDGKEWLQPVDFKNLSWDEVAVVCPVPNGLCSGTLGSTDVTGFIWAPIGDINALFNSYGVSPPLGSGPDANFSFPDSVMTAFFADFAPSSDNSNERITIGYSVDDENSLNGRHGYIGYVFTDQVPPKARTDLTGPKSSVFFPNIGVWLYRPVVAVPVPPLAPVPTISGYGLGLMSMGLLILAGRRLRTHGQS